MMIAELLAAARLKDAAKPGYATRSKRFYASFQWRALRYKVLAANAARNDGSPCCELCGARRRDGVVMNVDHIEPLSKNWARRLDKTNLQVLCAGCNHGKLNRDNTDFRPEGAAA